ncbi:MAG: asparagine synthase (glutamine-hydrolyzing) [Pseudomonadota bacterium]
MCGICGIFDHRGQTPLEIGLSAMLQGLSHRGTVDGHWIRNSVGLATRRLPIIDLAGSPQPLFNEDRQIVLVGNGEIYNYRELTNDLKRRGHRFSTHGDLECVLALYEEFGDGAWERLNGMFALALYDQRRQELVIVRDRLGIKPLFYAETPQGLLFSSEIASLRRYPGLVTPRNPQALGDYLSLQFVPRPQTAYLGIQSLAPGHWLKVGQGAIRIKSYWRLDLTWGITRSRAEVAAETHERLSTAVHRQLVADVPVGVLLSGGLDSSAIAALAARHHAGRLHSFAIVFREATFDESPFARQMARHLGTEHHELVLDETSILDSLEIVMGHFDEPFCEGSAIPLYHICRFAKSYVDVLLAGEGSDEIFGGYETYLARSLSGYFRHAPPGFFRVLGWLARRLPVSDHKVSFDLKLRRWVDGIAHSPATAHFWWRAALNDRDKRRVLNPDFIASLAYPDTASIYERVMANLPGEDLIQRLMATDCQIHLPDDLLYRADLMSMAQTLELRVPFLDPELVDYAFSLPSAQKIVGFTTKRPLRDAMKDDLPRMIRTRTKQGLNMPYQKWFKRPPWRDFLHDWLIRDRVEHEGILNFQGVSTLLAEHEAGRHNHAHGLWAILHLVLWLARP